MNRKFKMVWIVFLFFLLSTWFFSVGAQQTQSKFKAIDPNQSEPFLLLTSGLFFNEPRCTGRFDSQDCALPPIDDPIKWNWGFTFGPNLVDGKGVFLGGAFGGLSVEYKEKWKLQASTTYQNMEIEDIRADFDVYRFDLKAGTKIGASENIKLVARYKTKFVENNNPEHTALAIAEFSLSKKVDITTNLGFLHDQESDVTDGIIGGGLVFSPTKSVELEVEGVVEGDDHEWAIGAVHSLSRFNPKKSENITVGKIKVNLKQGGTVVLTYIAIF